MGCGTSCLIGMCSQVSRSPRVRYLLTYSTVHQQTSAWWDVCKGPMEWPTIRWMAALIPYTYCGWFNGVVSLSVLFHTWLNRAKDTHTPLREVHIRQIRCSNSQDGHCMLSVPWRKLHHAPSILLHFWLDIFRVYCSVVKILTVKKLTIIIITVYGNVNGRIFYIKKQHVYFMMLRRAWYNKLTVCLSVYLPVCWWRWGIMVT